MSGRQQGRVARRVFLGGVTASILSLTPAMRARANAPAAPSGGGFVALEARKGELQIRPAPAPKTVVWGYDGAVPGPVLRAKKGERVKVRLKNGLGQPTTIHWHGVRIANGMDGAAGLTQAPIAPGASFDYDFVAPDAGTFWYHPHVHPHTGEQLDRGMYGLLIVDEPAPPAVDREMLAVIDDWRLEPDGQIDPRFDAPADLVHAGRVGNILTVNAIGKAHEETLPPNARARIRLVNTANARVFNVKLEGGAFKIVAVDGQPASPFEPKGGAIAVPPGGRFDLMVDAPAKAGEEARITAVLPQQSPALLVLKAAGEPLPPRPPIAALPPNDLPERIDLARARRFDLLMQGGVDPNNHGPEHMRMMMNPTTAWTFNKAAGDGHSGKPLFSVKRGTPVVVAIKNDTAWPHAMHLHGHHFRTLFTFDDGWDPFWLDTALVDAKKTLRIAMVADNPGKWMLHCHMIEHQAAGMATWFEVT